MSDAIITALIMAAGSIICQLLINRNNRRKQESDAEAKDKARAVEEAKKAERLNARLESIEHKLDEHNGYAEKISSIQQDIAFIKGRMEKGA